MRGRFRLAQNGGKPSPGLLRNPTSPARGRGERIKLRADKQIRSRGALKRPSFASPRPRQNRFAPKEGAERRKAHANHRRRASKHAHLRHLCAFGAAARSCGARSPSGALLRHSPGRTHPPLAQLQFPRFLRPDLTGVTRFDLSQVYRAPRRPVVMPAERWPRAARERMANPPAGTAPAPLFRHAFRKGALNERGGGYVTDSGTCVKSSRRYNSDYFGSVPEHGLLIEILLKANEGIADGGHTAKGDYPGLD